MSAFNNETIPGDSGLARRLSREISGEVLFDRASRGRYSTDASIYQVEPLGVIVPETIDDVAAALAIAREAEIPVLPRGGVCLWVRMPGHVADDQLASRAARCGTVISAGRSFYPAEPPGS